MSTQNYNSDTTLQTTKFLPFKLEELTPEIIKKAEDELGETPERRQEALKQITRLIRAERDFRPLMDEKFLLGFLRCRKFDPEVAVKTLKNYYTFKLRYSRTLTDILPSEMQHVADLNMVTILPHRNPDGSIVGLCKLSLLDLDKASVDDLFATVHIGAEYALQSEATQICGLVVVIDLKGMSLRLIRHIASPTLLFRLVRAIQDCVPLRIKAVHFIREPFYFSLVYNILKKFLSEKIKSRFQFHGNSLANLHKQVPPEILPREFGGERGPLDSSELVKELLTMDNYYAKMTKYGYQQQRAQLLRRKSSMAFGLFL